MLKIQSAPVGELGVNCYVVTDEGTGRTAVVDPGGYNTALDMILKNVGFDKIDYILLTHGHFDHISGVASLLKKAPDAKAVLGKKDVPFINDNFLNLSRLFGGAPVEPFEADIVVCGGDKITLGESEFTVIDTPGHTQGSVCYLCGEHLFSGDTLFRRSAGRTDFPTGDEEQLMRSLRKLARLDDICRVYPGHNEETTIIEERRSNPYLNGLDYL